MSPEDGKKDRTITPVQKVEMTCSFTVPIQSFNSIGSVCPPNLPQSYSFTVGTIESETIFIKKTKVRLM